MRVIRRTSGDVGSEAVSTYASWDMMSLVDVPVRYDLAQSTCPPLRVGDLLDQDGRRRAGQGSRTPGEVPSTPCPGECGGWGPPSPRAS